MQWDTGKIKSKMKKQEENEEANVVSFTVIEGGKLKTAGKEPPSHDWLTEMTVNTMFLATPKQGYDPICGRFIVRGHAIGENKESAVELFQEGTEFWVMASRFCHKMRLVAILEKGI